MTGLFDVDSSAVALTSDDCYTPRWVFDAMGLRFDLDVAAPVAARSPGRALALTHADVVAVIDPRFERPSQAPRDIPQAVFAAFRGVDTNAARQLAAADPRGAVLYPRTAHAGLASLLDLRGPFHAFDCDRFQVYDYGSRSGDCDCGIPEALLALSGGEAS